MKKTVKSVFAKIINRTSITVVLIVMQALVLISWLTRLSEYAGYVDGISRVLALITALYIINRPDNPGFKLAIIVPILAFPIIGVPFYLLFGNSLRGMLNRQFVGRYNELAAAVEHSSEELSGAFAPQAAFLTRNACTSASTGRAPSITQVTQVPGASSGRPASRLSEGFGTSASPLSAISNTPISLVAPKRFFAARRMR